MTARKISDLDDKERRSEQSRIEAIAVETCAPESYDKFSTHANGGNNDEFGICATCDNLDMLKTEFNFKRARCMHWECVVDPHTTGRITECTAHSPKGVMTLNEMYALATFIDPDEKKIVKGFTQ